MGEQGTGNDPPLPLHHSLNLFPVLGWKPLVIFHSLFPIPYSLHL